MVQIPKIEVGDVVTYIGDGPDEFEGYVVALFRTRDDRPMAAVQESGGTVHLRPIDDIVHLEPYPDHPDPPDEG